MATYQVYKSPEGKKYAVEIGYNFYALFFNYIWALFARLWDKAITLIFISTALNALSNFLGKMYEDHHNPVFLYVQLIAVIAIFIIIFYVGKNGNRWLIESFEKKGYEKIGSVEAESKKQAIEKL